MMTKNQAIEWIKKIQTGEFDRNMIINEIPCGLIATNNWNDSMFAYGMEYGAIMALMVAFEISKSDLAD